ncbi:MAG: primosomal protein N' [Clostridium sp.]|nr:primosomal protein N' [Clostridium sp.]MCM1444594.1 primosomal protein N' [Candidatus Amulumruptor caecigallinarius]
MKAEVLVEIKAKNIDKTFTYSIPNEFVDKVKVGIRVLVPFGYQQLEGFVLDIGDFNVDYELKDIISLIDNEPVLNKEMLEIGKYLSKKTLCNLINCYQTMLPKAFKAKNGVTINKKYITYLELNNVKEDKYTKTSKEIINLLKNGKKLKSECIKISASSVKTLLNKGIIKEVKEEDYRLKEENNILYNKVILTNEQQGIVKKVLENKDKFIPYLLHGVTGSGKTEVYMEIISKIINNKQVIVLVPEISLTPQLIEKFRNRFGSFIAVLHSALSDGERYDEWRKIINKDAKVIIGARSAIFAPCNNIGLIIIDEEHSENYKQENNPRYSAIDVALFRAKYHKCPVLLGSATPSIESYTRAKSKIYNLLELKNRVNSSLPTVELVDMKDEIRHGNTILSQKLIDKINERLNKNEQVILLLNRRGYTTITMCKKCGFTHTCPNCDIPLIYHKSSNTMRCHYCGYGDRKLTTCPNCNNKDIIDYGLGTEKLEDIIKEKFQNSRVIRMDVDTTSTKGAHKKIVDAFKNEEYDILIGTQMIAKGLDFPKVTLVGVINADASLNIPDFRSGERTFQLLNQVSGRAGRSSLKGEVIIQGFNINNYSILCASTHDYTEFYNEEMKIRKKLNYPPFCNITRIEVTGKNYDVIFSEAEKIVTYINKTKDSSVVVLGPTLSNMAKINNIYHVQIIVKYKNTNSIIEQFKFIVNKYKQKKDINVDLDINSLKV